MKNLFTDGLRTKKHLLKTEIFSPCSSAFESTSKFFPPVGPLVLILYTIMVVTQKYSKSTISEVEKAWKN